jgi:RimJ/RimL family protein N-acetyltransferase
VYPRHLEREVTLRDGRRVFVRPVRPDDETRLAAFFGRLSQRTIYERFLAALPRIPERWVRQFSTVDYCARLGLIVEPVVAGATPVIALAQYEAMPKGAAEVAFVVRDDWQGSGLGTHLLKRIVDAAESPGFDHFQAWVNADNVAMLRMLRHTDVIARTVERGVVEVFFRRAADGVR